MENNLRFQLQPKVRQRIVNKIMNILVKHLSELCPELKNVAERLEEKIYAAAVDQSDYLRKIALKMLSIETKSQHNTRMNPRSRVNQNSARIASMEASSSDWRSQLQPEARQRVVNKIMDTLRKHLPVPVPEGMTELKKIAARFEEKIYAAAVNQSDYLRKISLKMLSMETKTQHNPQLGVNQISADIDTNISKVS